MRAAVVDDGTVYIVDERVADQFTPEADIFERLQYGFSVLHCLPATMAEDPVVANGTVLRRPTLEAWAQASGFSDVEGPDGVVPVRSAMQRRLLTALVVADGDTVSVNRLITTLWGQDPPASARNSLQTYVARVRDLLGDAGAVATRPPGYALDLDVADVDARQVAEARDAGHDLLADDPEEAARRLAAALARWRGEAHAEFADDVAREEAVRLQRLRGAIAELLADAHERCGRPGQALAILDHVLAQDPLREPAVLARARVLGAQGQLPAALAGLREHRARLADDLGLDPSPALEHLEQQLLRGQAAPPGPPATGPATSTTAPGSAPRPSPRVGATTVGRDRDRARITEALDRSRLVTLVGPGGVGKTHLAAVTVRGAGPHAWVDLAPVRAAGDVAPAIVDSLGLVRHAGEIEHVVVDGLGRFPGTVVLDNCEHVIDAVSALVNVTLDRGGRGQILATSRERLDVPGEVVVPVAPLDVPAPEDASDADPAVRMFLERLVAAGGQPVAAADAARVAARVDGLPLALELAAARAVTMPIETLVGRLSDRLDVLEGTRRRHGDRHRTVARVIDWSYDLLAPADRMLLDRLAVFVGAFTVEAAETVCVDGALDRPAVTLGLGRLVEQSLVMRTDDGRLRLLEPIRLYASDHLGASPDSPAMFRQHTHAMLALAARADAAMSGPDEAAVVAELERSLPDLRAARARALAAGDLDTVARLAGQLYRFAYVQARSEVLGWGAVLEDDAAAYVAPDLRGRALAAAAGASFMIGELERGLRQAMTAEAMTRDPWCRITVLEILGDVRNGLGDVVGARDAYDEMLGLCKRLDHDGLAAHALAGVALADTLGGDLATARAVAGESLRLAEASGAATAASLANYTVGDVVADDDPDAALAALEESRRLAVSVRASFLESLARTADMTLRGRHGDPVEALARYDEALRSWRDVGTNGIAVTALRNLVVLFVRVGADLDALHLFRATERFGGKPTFGAEQRRMLTAVEAARGRLGPRVNEPAPWDTATPDVATVIAHAMRTIDRLRERDVV